MSKQFKPMLMPNDSVDFDFFADKFKDYLITFKLDGIRCIVKNGEIYSRALKPIPNKQLQKKFEQIKKYTKNKNIILDGEIYSENHSFQEITSVVRTEDKEVPKDFKFYCFDIVTKGMESIPYSRRIMDIGRIERELYKQNKNDEFFYGFGNPYKLFYIEELRERFKDAIGMGYEGLILRHKDSPYKYGRTTIREGYGYKLKPYRTWDAKIKGCYQATKVDPNAKKTINELGHSVTSKKKDDRMPVDRCAGFYVDYKGKELKVTFAATNEEKAKVWKNRKKYIGKMIEYKGMEVGAKDVPRHPVFIRFRKDRDE